MLSIYRFAICVLLLATAAYASPITYSGVLSPLAENPPNPTSVASGFATVTFDPVTEMLNVTFSYSNLASGATGAHIHCCVSAGGNAIVATSVPAFVGFVLGATSGTFSATYDMTQSPNYNPQFVTANGGTIASAETAFSNGFVGGMTYLNIHDANFPGGEIRLVMSPEPGTILLMPMALAMLRLTRRKRSA
jgi:hypothetical protein